MSIHIYALDFRSAEWVAHPLCLCLYLYLYLGLKIYIANCKMGFRSLSNFVGNDQKVCFHPSHQLSSLFYFYIFVQNYVKIAQVLIVSVDLKTASALANLLLLRFDRK